MMKRPLIAILVMLASAELLLRALPVTYRIQKVASLTAGQEIVRQNRGGTYSSQFDFVNVRQVHINRDQFVSAREFERDRTAIGLFGDSFTEALMVAHPDKMDALLEKSTQLPVYNFAKRGDTATDALAQLRYARANYRIENAVIIFGEDAIIPTSPTNGAFYLDQAHGELTFSGLSDSTLRGLIGYSALARYAFFNLNLNAQFANTVARVKQSAFGGAFASHADNTADTVLAPALAERYLAQLQHIWQQPADHVCLVFNSDFSEMYDGKAAPRLKPSAAALMVLAQAKGMRVVDLSPVFAADFSARSIKFDSAPYDRHWNAYGHLVVATTLRERCLDHTAP
jgi:hypothetical protein